MLLALFLRPTAIAATLSVGSGGTYSTISNAIAAASDGDTIEVGPGTYSEAIDFNGKAISIQSTDGAASTIIAGNGSVSVSASSAESHESQLSGFTIQGDGHPCLQLDSSSPHLANLRVEGCGSADLPYGGGGMVMGA